MERERNAAGEQVISSFCAHHCGGSCLLKVHVKDGNVVRIDTDDELRGCVRGRALRQQIDAPDRLKYPLKRIGPRGSARFERISWDSALGIAAQELKRIRATYGNAAILSGGGAGNVTLVHGMNMAMNRLLNMFGGYTDVWGFPSWEAATFASSVNYGTIYVGNSREDLVNSRLIILWGLNPAATVYSTNTMYFTAKAREAGARIVSIDPKYSNAAATVADEWVPIVPGSDTALALAMANVIISEGLQDQRFIERYTVGFDRFKDYVLGTSDGEPKDPRWAQSRTGIPTDTIRQLAQDYARRKPAALLSGISVGRTAFGEQFHRVTATLAAITGNVGIHGGEAAGRAYGDQFPYNPYPFKIGPYMAGGKNPVDDEAPNRDIAIPTYKAWGSKVPRSLARVHQGKVADAILRGRSGGYHADYKAFIAYNHNWVNQFPHTRKWDQALKKLEFMLVLEQFMTATARYADIVLPTCTIFERNDIIAAGNKSFYGFLKKVIEPRHESKSQLDICTLLAGRLGIDQAAYNDKTDEEWVRQIATGGGEAPDWSAFKESGVYHVPREGPYISFEKEIEDPEHHPFPTPSGKIEIYSQVLADLKNPLLPPLPTHFEPEEGRHSSRAKMYPLQVVNIHSLRRSHSQFETLPWLRELVPNEAEMHTSDAEKRSLKDGDSARIYNDRGEVRMRLRVTERIMPGVINVPQGAWFQPDEKGIDRGGCPNTLCSDNYSPCGSFTWNSCLAEVEKAED